MSTLLPGAARSLPVASVERGVVGIGCSSTLRPAELEPRAPLRHAVAGGYAERLSGRSGPGATSLRYPDGGGSSSGGGDLPDEADRLLDPDAVVALGGAAWPAWPRRA